MNTICQQKSCYTCCKNTNMLLLEKDIQTIKQQGYETAFFTTQKKGWSQLKNHNGRCVFHNGKKCIIYEYRPEGCRLYPVVYSKDSKTAILDQECPHPASFQISHEKTQSLYTLVSQLEFERETRKKI
jgi:uncharacterized protein